MDEGQVKASVLKLLAQPHLVVVFSTVDGDGRPHSRLMGAMVPVPGEEFSWYLETALKSRKVEQVLENPQGQILAFNPDYTEIIAVSGKAALVNDDGVRKMVWEAVPGSSEYFSDWKSPDFAILRFDAAEIEYLNLTLRLEPFTISVQS